MRRKTYLTAAACTVVFIACSMVDSAADVTVTGTLKRQDESAAADLKTLLIRIPDPLELLTGGLAVVGSVGLVCVYDEPPPTICKTVQSATANAEGKFTYQMKGTDVKGSLGQVSFFTLLVGLPPPAGAKAGPSVGINSFVIQKEMLTLPPLKFWEPVNVSAAVTAATITVSWDLFGISHQHEPSAGYQVSFYAGGEVWSQAAMKGEALDARAVEDTQGTFAVSASDQVGAGGVFGGDEFALQYGSKGIGYAATGNPLPASRGKGCAVATKTGVADVSPCPLTNGAFDDSFTPQAPCEAMDAGSCAANSFVQVDLGAPAPVRDVFVHGLTASGKVVLEVSDDGVTFTEKARSDLAGRFMKLSPAAATTARYVRLRVLQGGISGLNELSVW